MTEGKNQFSPVPHTSLDDAMLFSNAEFKKAWDDLEEEYAALLQLLLSRHKAPKEFLKP
jgi:hypothetical protein